MLRKEIKIGLEILSPNEKPWIITKIYSKDFILIRQKKKNESLGKLCALSQGQFRLFRSKT